MLPDYCLPTKEWMDQLESDGYRVIDIETPMMQNKIYDGFLDNWGIDDILIVHQEHLGTSEMIEDMKNCKHDFCASPCKIYKSDSGYEAEKINMVDFLQDNKVKLYDFEYLKGKDFVNGICGTGLCYIKKGLQLKMDIKLNPFHEQNVDSILSELARPYMKKGFHLHELHHNNKAF